MNSGVEFKLAIVVLTYERAKFAVRQIEFWKNNPVKVYVLDGSIVGIDSNYIDSLPNNIFYYHMPFSVENRLEKVIDLLDVPYTMLLGDDEFMIPSAVNACVNELDINEELVACMGLASKFWYGPNNKILANTVYDRLMDYKVDQSSALERMIYHMNSYVCSTIYGVVRTDVWKKNIGLVIKNKYSSPVISELQFELGSCAQGKSKVINKLMWLRSGENPPIAAKNWDRSINFFVWYNDEIYKQEHDNFKRDFSIYLFEELGVELSTQDVTDILEGHYQFLKKRQNRSTISRYKKNIVSKLRMILSYLSPSLITRLRTFLNNIHYYVYADIELSEITSKYANFKEPVVDVQSLLKIEKIIQDFRLKG